MANFIGGHKLLLYRAFYIANLASEAGIEREAERAEKLEEITNRSEPQGRWQCLKKPLDSFQTGGMMPSFRVNHLIEAKNQ